MKRLAWTAFIIAAVILGGVLFLNSAWMKEHALVWISKGLADAGLEVEVAEVHGSLPHEVVLKQFRLHSSAGWTLEADTLRAELSLIYLLNGELHFDFVEGDGIRGSFPPSWSKYRETESLFVPKLAVSIERIKLSQVEMPFGGPAELTGSAKLDAEGHGSLNLRIKQEETQLRFRLAANPLGSVGNAKGTWRDIPFAFQFRVYGSHEEVRWELPSFYTKGLIHGISEETGIQFTSKSSTEWLEEKWTQNAKAVWTPGISLQCSSFTLSGPSTEVTGSFELLPDLSFHGQATGDATNLHVFSPLNIYGSLHASCDFSDLAFNLQGTTSNLYYGELTCEGGTFDAHGNWKGPIYAQLQLQDIHYRDLHLATLFLDSSTEGENHPFTLSAQGEWEKPLNLSLDGSWSWQEHYLLCTLQTGSGSFFQHPYLLAVPAQIEASSNSFRISDLSIAMAGASIHGSYSMQPDETSLQAQISRLPLDILSLNPLNVAVTGYLNCTADWQQKKSSAPQGNLVATLRNLEIQTEDRHDPLTLDGNFEGHLNRDQLTFSAEIPSLLNAKGEIPWSDPDGPASGIFSFHGQIEQFLDFFNLGVHSLRGICDCDLTLSGTLNHPKLKGSCHWSHGFYENYFTGTELREIDGKLVAKGSKVRLTHFTAVDSDELGSLSASGRCSLNLKKRFPFDVDIQLKDFRFAQLNWMTSQADGHIELRGNLNGASASGHCTLLKSDLSIANRSPRPLPILPVTYRNAIKPPPTPPTARESVYPIKLDLQISAPSGVTISGRGLSSEWMGNFDLSGTYTAIAAKGVLELVSGEFSFSSRTFRLTEGSLTFSGKEGAMPNLSLMGTMDARGGIVITAWLRGPLNQPLLTFRSQPPLPLSSILSHLLFGQDLSEIGGFQALQLANTIANLSADSPQLLESTRRSLGVDHLRVISSPSGNDEEADRIALQVGTYIAKGVIISFSQGTDDSSSNISINVDISHGFFFEAQSQQDPEQGKFTIKWVHNY